LNSSQPSKTGKSSGDHKKPVKQPKTEIKIPSKRKPGWEQKFNNLIERNRRRKFKWGEHDCMHFAAEVIRELGIDVDVIKKHRGKFKTATAVKKILKQNGGMRKFALEIFKEFPQISLHSAKRGDVVLMDVGGEDFVIGVCVGMEAAVLGPEGTDFVSIKQHGKIVWAIGHK